MVYYILKRIKLIMNMIYLLDASIKKLMIIKFYKI